MTSCDHIQGAIATAGQVVQWLRDEMKFISSASEIGEYEMSKYDNVEYDQLVKTKCLCNWR